MATFSTINAPRDWIFKMETTLEISTAMSNKVFGLITDGMFTRWDLGLWISVLLTGRLRK